MFSPNRSAAHQRLQAFLPHAGRAYARQRNFDRGPGAHDSVSRLSPWLRRRVLLEEEVLQAVCREHGAEAAGKFIDEVFWRTYFRGWMAHHTATWAAFEDACAQVRQELGRDHGLRARIEAAEAGATGNQAFDAWARELVDSGYLHNHARMWFASIWIFTLRLPWVLGADFFLRHLLDGDPASNTLGWRWVAGLHTRGKTYLARRENILRYTEGRLDPGSGLAMRATALAEPEPPRPNAIEWPAAPVSGRRNGWLITDEDCRADLVRGVPDSPLFGLLTGRETAGDAQGVKVFSRGCITDALARCGQDDAPIRSSPDGVAVRTWAMSHDLDTVHTHFVPFGPVADALAAVETALAAAGIRLQQHVRTHDLRCWPHARRGFFQLRKRIPELLAAGEAVDA